MRMLRTALAAAAVALCVGLTASSPASAGFRLGPGHFGGGFGPGRFGGNFGPGRFDHWRHGGYWGGVGVIDVGGDADDGCIRWRPVYDRFGNYVGRRPVNICE